MPRVTAMLGAEGAVRVTSRVASPSPAASAALGLGGREESSSSVSCAFRGLVDLGRRQIGQGHPLLFGGGHVQLVAQGQAQHADLPGQHQLLGA